jgi:hypothetical protein
MVVSRATPAHGQVDKCPLRRKTAGVARFGGEWCWFHRQSHKLADAGSIPAPTTVFCFAPPIGRARAPAGF